MPWRRYAIAFDIGPGCFSIVTARSAFCAISSCPSSVATTASSLATAPFCMSASSATLSHAISTLRSPAAYATRAMRCCSTASSRERRPLCAATAASTRLVA